MKKDTKENKVMNKFFFPKENKTIEAESYEEAIKILNK